MNRILIIEDEHNLALGLKANLEIEGHEVMVAPTGLDGLAHALSWSPNVIILDLMLPGMDGYEVLARLRARGIETPVLILSARSEEVDKVRGFRTGADDYVTKPFGVMELMLRVKALLRRASPGAREAETSWQFGEVNVDATRRTVRRRGAEVAISPKAFELLITLLANPNTTMTRQKLLQTVWGYDSSVTTRTVDAHIAELRRKLEREQSAPIHILTVHRVGYRFRP